MDDDTEVSFWKRKAQKSHSFGAGELLGELEEQGATKAQEEVLVNNIFSLLEDKIFNPRNKGEYVWKDDISTSWKRGSGTMIFEFRPEETNHLRTGANPGCPRGLKDRLQEQKNCLWYSCGYRPRNHVFWGQKRVSVINNIFIMSNKIRNRHRKTMRNSRRRHEQLKEENRHR